MSVYFIRAGDNGPVKIGTAEDVAGRLRELQCGNHEDLRLLRVVEGCETMLAIEPAPTARRAWPLWPAIATGAAELGVGAEAIRKWRERGKVPYRWRLPLLNAAKARRKRLDESIFDNLPRQAAS